MSSLGRDAAERRHFITAASRGDSPRREFLTLRTISLCNCRECDKGEMKEYELRIWKGLFYSKVPD